MKGYVAFLMFAYLVGLAFVAAAVIRYVEQLAALAHR
jgi:hypothetical protein